MQFNQHEILEENERRNNNVITDGMSKNIVLKEEMELKNNEHAKIINAMKEDHNA